MQQIIEQLEQLASMVKTVDLSDLTLLADMHSRFEKLAEIAGHEPSLSNTVQQTLSDHGQVARKKLEQLILSESQDAAASMKAVASTVQALQDAMSGSASSTASIPTPPIDEFAEAQKEAQANPTPTTFPTAPAVFSADDLPLLAEFINESNSHLENAEQEILKLEEEPGNLEAIGALFRAFHTIKGVAGFLNLNQIQSLAHAAESLLDLGREGKVQITGRASQLVLEASDLMKKLVIAVDTAVRESAPLLPTPGVEQLTKKLNQFSEKVARGEIVEEAIDESITNTAAEATPEAKKPASAPSGDNTVKVATDRLDSLINMVGELVIAQAMVGQDVTEAAKTDQRLARHVTHLNKIVRDLQDLSMSLRMVPVNSVFRKMTRLVRDVARKAGKEVELVLTGSETELDRNVVDALADPLVHMVRNSVDHGIEPPTAREAVGKTRTGRIELKAYHKGGNINIEIIDDGRGLNKDKILKKAIENGLVRADEQLSDNEIYKLVFAAGLSTADKVTDISGRGVGMDVVKRNIDSLRGRVDIASEPGKGSVFTIRLPLTLAVIDGLVVKVGPNKYIVPITSIEQSIRPTAEMLSTVQNRGELVNIRGTLLPLVRLHRLFNAVPVNEDPTQTLVVIVQDNDRRVCLLVDELLGQEQVVIKSLGEGIGSVGGLSGGAVLGDGNVSLILDVPGIIEAAMI